MVTTMVLDLRIPTIVVMQATFSMKLMESLAYQHTSFSGGDYLKFEGILVCKYDIHKVKSDFKLTIGQKSGRAIW